jgi:hypothetical protein
MEVDALEDGEIYDEAGEEVVMEDMNHAKLKNKVVKPKRRVAGKTGPELSSEDELRAKFSTVRSRKKRRKLITDDVKHSTNTHQNLNESRNRNEAKERTEEVRIQQVESEAQNLGNKGTNNGKEDLGEGFMSNRNGKINDLLSKCMKTGHSTST